MKRYLVLACVLCFLVGCGTEPTSSEDPPACTSVGETWTRPADGMEMVCVPAGEFLMGSSDEDIDAVLAECGDCDREWFADEQPQHAVYLDAFWIDQTEVTNAQYRKCVKTGACEEPGCWDNSNFDAPQQPVVCVTWDDATAYAAWVEGQLPTEAEWEKAASWDPMKEQKRLYPSGDSFGGRLMNFCDANCSFWWKDSTVDDGYAATAPIGSYPEGASFYGALDMAGNAMEWVADWYGEGYYSESPSSNPLGPSAGEYRVERGGSFYDYQWDARCTYRNGGLPDYRSNLAGFRVVVALAPP